MGLDVASSRAATTAPTRRLRGEVAFSSRLLVSSSLLCKLVCCLLLLQLPFVAAIDTPSQRRPSFLVIMADDLRVDESYAAPVSPDSTFPYHLPNLQRLMSQGVTFESAFANFPSCGPSRQSFLTGRVPDALRVWNLIEHFRAKQSAPQSLPEYLRTKMGYITVSIGKIFHHDKIWGVDETRSWTYANLGQSGTPKNPKCPKIPRKKPYGSYFCDCVDNVSGKNTCADSFITQDVLQRLPNLAYGHMNGSPFFLAVGFRRPHLDWLTPPNFRKSGRNKKAPQSIPVPPYAVDYPPTSPAVAYFACSAVYNRGEGRLNNVVLAPSGGKRVNDNLASKMRDAYWAAAALMDKQMGIVLDALEKSGVAEETIVLFFSDHGWSLGERGLWCKQSLQDSAVRMPLVVKIPWLHQNLAVRRTWEPVEMLDIFPTVASLAAGGLDQVDYRECLQGDDLSFILTSARPDLEKKSASLGKYGGTVASYPRCLRANQRNNLSAPAYLEECTNLPPQRISFMGYSFRNREYRYTEWRRWKQDELVADWTDDGLVAVELYDYRLTEGLIRDDRNARQELTNFANRPMYESVQRGLREALHARVLDPKFASATCSTPSTPTNAPIVPPSGGCNKAKTSEECASMASKNCEWFPGYDFCRKVNFCGFPTKSYVGNVGPFVRKATRAPTTRMMGMRTKALKVPPGTPGCKQYWSICVWRNKKCTKRGGGSEAD